MARKKAAAADPDDAPDDNNPAETPRRKPGGTRKGRRPRGRGSRSGGPLGAKPKDAPEQITDVLRRWRDGSPEAGDKLMRLVQSELRKLAASYLRRERSGHTLQPTEIVNEAYMRLLPQRGIDWASRSHFYGIAAQMMRRILVDHARRKRAAKREGPEGDPVSLSQVPDPAGGQDIDVLMLHEALEDLAKLDARQAQIVELRFFGGLKIEEVADASGVAPATVKRELTTAVAWLRHRMKA